MRDLVTGSPAPQPRPRSRRTRSREVAQGAKHHRGPASSAFVPTPAQIAQAHKPAGQRYRIRIYLWSVQRGNRLGTPLGKPLPRLPLSAQRPTPLYCSQNHAGTVKCRRSVLGAAGGDGWWCALGLCSTLAPRCRLLLNDRAGSEHERLADGGDPRPTRCREWDLRNLRAGARLADVDCPRSAPDS